MLVKLLYSYWWLITGVGAFICGLVRLRLHICQIIESKLKSRELLEKQNENNAAKPNSELAINDSKPKSLEQEFATLKADIMMTKSPRTNVEFVGGNDEP
jgi:hypothetical protein